MTTWGEDQHSADLAQLTAWFGEWYRIWHQGRLWWAQDEHGDKLSGDTPEALAALIRDHLSLLHTGRRP